MEGVRSWLNQPLLALFDRLDGVGGGSCACFWRWSWSFFWFGVGRNENRRGRNREPPITERPAPLPVLELANLQGIGSREEQQDAFGISPVDRYEEDGLLAVLCDGMGGMAGGRPDRVGNHPLS